MFDIFQFHPQTHKKTSRKERKRKIEVNHTIIASKMFAKRFQSVSSDLLNRAHQFTRSIDHKRVIEIVKLSLFLNVVKTKEKTSLNHD